MTEAELAVADYKRYPGPGPWIHADHCFQKRIISVTPKHTLYFIDFGMWNMTQYPDEIHIGWAAQVVFHRGEDRTLKLDIPLNPDDTIAGIEAIFAEFYQVMGCVSDRYNQD